MQKFPLPRRTRPKDVQLKHVDTRRTSAIRVHDRPKAEEQDACLIETFAEVYRAEEALRQCH